MNLDGSVNSTDSTVIVNHLMGISAAYIADYDLDLDGTVSFKDSGKVSTYGTRTLADGQLSDRGNIVGWCGYLYEESTGMWLARHRWQIPELGRWANRDPIGYAGGGQNLYEYVNGNPIFYQDPMGLKKYNVCEKLWESTGDVNKYLDCKQKQGGGTFRVGTMAGSSDASANIRRDIDETVEAIEEVVGGAVQFVADTAQAIAESHAACVAKCYATERLLRDMAQTALNGAAGAIPGLISVDFDLYSDDWYLPNVSGSIPGFVDAATDPEFYDQILLNKSLSEKVGRNKIASKIQDNFFSTTLKSGAVGVAFAAGQSALFSTAKSISYCIDKCDKQRDSELNEYCGG